MRLPDDPALRSLVLYAASARGQVRVSVSTIMEIGKAARRVDLRLRAEIGRRRQKEREADQLRGKLELELSRQAGLIEPPSVSFKDPQPTEPVALVIHRHKTGLCAAWRSFWSILRGADAPHVWACPKCGKTHVRQGRAADCCKLRGPHPCACGATIEWDYTTKCDDCQEREKLLKAERVASDDHIGWVHTDEIGYNDGFLGSIDELVQYCHDEGIDVPAYVWACSEDVWGGLDAYGAIESDLDDHHEEAFDSVVDLHELMTFVKSWNAKQSITTYSPDYGRVVVLDRVRFAALMGESLPAPKHLIDALKAIAAEPNNVHITSNLRDEIAAQITDGISEEDARRLLTQVVNAPMGAVQPRIRTNAAAALSLPGETSDA